MACASDECLRRTELQIEPVFSEGYGVMKALRAVVEVIEDTYELQRELAKRYPTMRG